MNLSQWPTKLLNISTQLKNRLRHLYLPFPSAREGRQSTEGRVLMWSSTHSDVAVDKEVRKIKGSFGSIADITVLLPTASYIQEGDAARHRNILSRVTPEFDHVVFAEPVRLYRSGYASDVVHLASQFLTSSGIVWFPKALDEGEADSPLVSISWLEEIFGYRFESVSPDGKFVGWANPLWANTPRSIFEVTRHIVNQLPNQESKSTRLTIGVERSSIAYQLAGANYKGSAVTQILNQTQPEESRLEVLSFGGGVGMTEMALLADDLRIVSVTNVEPDETAHNFGTRLFATAVAQEVISSSKTYKQILAEAENYRPEPESVDVVIFFGVLFLIGPNELAKVLRRSWDALRPGGVLVVHEHLKSDSFASQPYFSKMLTAKDLGAALGDFGPERLLDSFSLREISVGENTDKVVFRFIQKARKW